MKNRITQNSDICNGLPIIRNKRITVKTILEFIEAGNSIETILEQYPSLVVEDIYTCQEYAKQKLK